MRQQLWDDAVENKRLRAELWRLRGRLRVVGASRDLWRRKYWELWRNYTKRRNP